MLLPRVEGRQRFCFFCKMCSFSMPPASTVNTKHKRDTAAANVPVPLSQNAPCPEGCFWSVELAYQRTPGVTKTAVGYCQARSRTSRSQLASYAHRMLIRDACFW